MGCARVRNERLTNIERFSKFYYCIVKIQNLRTLSCWVCPLNKRIYCFHFIFCSFFLPFFLEIRRIEREATHLQRNCVDCHIVFYLSHLMGISHGRIHLLCEWCEQLPALLLPIPFFSLSLSPRWLFAPFLYRIPLLFVMRLGLSTTAIVSACVMSKTWQCLIRFST